MEVSNSYTHIKLQSNITITDEFRAAILKLMSSMPPADWDVYAHQISIVANPETVKRILTVYSEVGQNPPNRMQTAARLEEYLSRQAIPIYGHWYSIVSSDQANEDDVFFVIKSKDAEQIPWEEIV